MRLQFIIALLILVPIALGATTKTFTDNQTYTIFDQTYVIHPYNTNATIVEQNGSSQILQKGDCLTAVTIRSCLQSPTATQAGFSEENLAAILKADNQLSATTVMQGDKITGTITLTNSGTFDAKQVELKMTLPDGLQTTQSSSDGKNIIITGSVQNTREVNYDIEALQNGSYTWNGTLTYFDGNDTQEIAIKEVKLTVKNPVVVTVDYNKTASGEPNLLKFSVKRDSSTNVSFEARILFPPQAQIISVTRSGSARETNNTAIDYRELLNSSDAYSFNASYTFLAAPSGPIKTIIDYTEEDSIDGEQEFNFTLPLETIEDTEPSLAVQADSFKAGEPGLVNVLITGSRNGELVFSGDYNTTIDAVPGAQNISLTLPSGNHTINISFTSQDIYGQNSTTSGIIDIDVPEETEMNATDLAETSILAQELANRESNATTNETIPAPITITTGGTLAFGRWFYIVLALCAVSLLFTFGIVIRRLTDPLNRIEQLTNRVAKMRQELESKEMKGKARPEDLEALRELENQLGGIEKRLEK